MPNQITPHQLLTTQILQNHLIIAHCDHLMHQVKSPLTTRQQTTLINQQTNYLNTWFQQLPADYQNLSSTNKHWTTKLTTLQQKTQTLLNDQTWLTTEQLNEKRFNHHYLNYLQQVQVIEKFITKQLLKTKAPPHQQTKSNQQSQAFTQKDPLNLMQQSLYQMAKAMHPTFKNFNQQLGSHIGSIPHHKSNH